MIAVTAAQREARTAHVRRAATRSDLRYLAVGHGTFGTAFWVVFGLVAVIVPLVVDASGGRMDDGGVLWATSYSARWVAFSVAAGGIHNLAAAHLAAGGTRRTLFRGAVAGSAVAGFVYGALFGVARVGERTLFGSLGFTWSAPPSLGTLAGADGAALAALGEALAVTAYTLAGAGVVAAFLGARHRGQGILAVLVLAATVLAADLTTQTGSLQGAATSLAERWQPDGAAGVVVATAASLAVVVLAAGWLWLRLRRVQLRPPT